MEKEENILDIKMSPKNVHGILAQSYSVTFFLFLLGIVLDFLFKLEYLKQIPLASLGTLLIILGTLLIFLAQRTSRKLDIKNLSKETFLKGPYRLTRSPTHWGLLFLTIGFGMITSATFIILTSILAFIVSKMFFLKREEKILAQKYGVPYLEYKKTVRL